MGAHVLVGRDEAYIPAARRQFTQFPGLGLTVHEIVTNGEQLAMRFSEHGAYLRHKAVASWCGLGLYRWNGRRLTDNCVEQDYFSRRRQLATGRVDQIEPPAPAPWDTLPCPGDTAAERAVRDWIANGMPGDGVRRDEGDTTTLLAEDSSEVDELFSAGSSVAFRLSQRGRYAGGLGGVGAVGGQATLHLVGLVDVRDGRIAGGHIVRDRLGLSRSLERAPN
jgi:predicted ester cyclase